MKEPIAKDQNYEKIRALWRKIRLNQRGRLSARYKAYLAAAADDPVMAEKLAGPLLEELTAAEKSSLHYHAQKLTCTFPEDLPITEKIPAIRTALKENQVVIVCGSTGSGKTTQLPKAALLEGFGRAGRIGCTQPRRLAATALASRFATETGVANGGEVGYKVRFDDHTTENTVVKFMTDGILLAETRTDPLLLQYDCIILDEVHERSLNIDFLLGYLKLLLKKRRDLRIIISSATLESERISDFFHGAPIVEVEGKLFPIEDIWQESGEEDDDDLSEAIARAVETLTEFDKNGDILVFLPGEREIRDALDMLDGRNYPHTEVMPLFGRLSAAEQNRIFQRSSRRRIILATNVAETSLTIPGIRFVIDTGLVRLSRYNPKSSIQELRVEFISKASARQRRGRCGRLRDGVCVHLYSEAKLEEADDYTAPEIQRSSLAGVILQMAALKLPPIEVFPFVDPPSPALIKEGRITLDDLGATDEQGKLTKTGWAMSELPVGPRIGKMILAAQQRHVLPEILVIAAFLSMPDPRERPFEHAKEADAAQRQFDAEGSDFLSAIILWREMEKQPSTSALRRFANRNYLNFKRLREWRNLVADLAEIIEYKEGLPDREVDSDTIHQVLMSALPRQLGMFDPEKKCYLDRNGRKFQVFPGSVLARAKSAARWILSFTIVETTRPYARCNAVVDGLWLEKAAPRLCTKTYDSIHWNADTGFVSAREKVMAGQLLIHPGRRCHYGRINPEKSREVFIREALASGAIHAPEIPWCRTFEQNYRFLQALEIRKRRPDSLLDRDGIFAHFNKVLPPDVCSVDTLRRNRKSFLPDRAAMVYDPEDLKNEADFPSYLVQSGAKLPLRYVFDPGEKNDGITILAEESELPLISPNALTWLVPGYLPFLLEPMLRSLPKVTRKELMPMAECAEKFVAAVKEGHIFTDQPLVDALCDYLAENYGVVLGASDFVSFEPMEFQRMKIAVLDEQKKVKQILYEVPDTAKTGSKIAKSHKASKRFDQTGCTDWQEGLSLPDTVAVSPDGKKLAYPALCDEGSSVGVSLYLDKTEANLAHLAGLRRLVKLAYPQMIKHLASMLKFPHSMELSFFIQDKNWKNNLVDYAIDNSWRVIPRDEETFRTALEELRDTTGEKVAQTVSSLESLYKDYQKMEKYLDRLDRDSDTYEDVSMQLDFLFREGFLKTGDAFAQYRRYIKSLAIRLERAVSDPKRDSLKGADLYPYLDKFYLAYDNLEKPLEQLPRLYDFFLLLEEARISIFSPEIKTIRKATLPILEAAWKEMRL